MPEWLVPAITLIAGIVGSMVGATWIVSGRFRDIENLIRENQALFDRRMDSHIAQMAAAMEAIRTRLLRLEFASELNGRSKRRDVPPE